MKDKITIFFLALKYWFQGDDWTYAKEYATRLVRGFRRRQR